MILGKNGTVNPLVSTLVELRLLFSYEEHAAEKLPSEVHVNKDETAVLEVNT